MIQKKPPLKGTVEALFLNSALGNVLQVHQRPSVLLLKSGLPFIVSRWKCFREKKEMSM